MAKAPSPEEHFRITCEPISKARLGDVMAELSRLEIPVSGCEHITSVKTFKKTTHDTKAADFLREWVNDHPTFKAKEAVIHFDLHGRTAGAAYSGLRDLVEEGILKKLGEGNYARKDVKHLPAPKKVKSAAKPKPAAPVVHEVSHPDYILKQVRRRKAFTRDDVRELLSKDGRTPQSCGPTLSVLLKRGDIKRTGEGQYEPITKPVNDTEVAKVAEAYNG